MKRIPGWFCALTAVLCLPGCESLPWEQGGGDVPAMEGELEPLEPMPAPDVPDGLPLSTRPRFNDVPVPAGVEEDFDRTYVYESSTLQVGRMVYTTREDVSDIASFYLREAPLVDWQLQSSLQAEGIHLMFEKPGKRLEVSIRPQGVGRSNLLILNLTPDESR